MTVFVAAGDESDGPLQDGPFIYGGFVAPSRDWSEWFAPAWEQDVLNGDPPIPYLHMTDIRKRAWREQFGLSRNESDRRVDEAVRIIEQMGSLGPLKTEFDGGHFRRVFGETKIVRDDNQPGIYRFEPDYVAFLGFAYAAVEYVGLRHPEAERVDFLVERKTAVTRNIGAFLKHLAGGLHEKGQGHLVRIIGKLIPDGKENVPLQAADVAVWHLRRYATNRADALDVRRLHRMFDGREMMTNRMTLEQISGMGQRSKQNPAPNPFRARSSSAE